MGKLYLFSEVRGVVMHNGKPIAGAAVAQSYRRGDQNGRADTKTNERGEFHFPAVIRNSFWASILPHEPFIEQSILIQHDGLTYQAWTYDKRNYRQDGELGKPISLHCALESPPKRIEILSKVNSVFGICELR